MKTVVINLPDRKDRIESFNVNNPNLEYELFTAVEGYKISYDKLLSQGFDTNHDWIDPLLNTPLTKGEVGCFLSHWHIWNKCIEKNESILVLEDDVVFVDDFMDKFFEGYNFIPDDWDMIYLGCNHKKKYTRINDYIVKCNFAYTTSAMIIRNKAYEKMLEATKHMHRQIDVVFAGTVQF